MYAYIYDLTCTHACSQMTPTPHAQRRRDARHNPDSFPNQVAAQLASHGLPAAELLPPLQRALALQPLDAQVRQALATTLGALGRTDESASTLRAARSQ